MSGSHDTDVVGIIPLDKLISKYRQITKLAAKYHDGFDRTRSTKNKNDRDVSVLHYLIELETLMKKHL